MLGCLDATVSGGHRRCCRRDRRAGASSCASVLGVVPVSGDVTGLSEDFTR